MRVGGKSKNKKYKYKNKNTSRMIIFRERIFNMVLKIKRRNIKKKQNNREL